MNTRRGALVFTIPLLAGMLVISWIVLLGALRPVTADAMVSQAPSAAYDVEIGPNQSSSANPGDVVAYTHVVSNTGTQDDTYTITLSIDQSFPITVSQTSLPVTGGMTATVVASITVPSTATGNTEAVASVTATSVADSEVQATAVDTTTVNNHTLFLPLTVSAPAWEEVGSSTWTDGDTARALVVCSDVTTTIFAAATDADGANGLRQFRGFAWEALGTADIPSDETITSLAANTACDKLYVGTYGHGVWVGTKGIKDTWTWSQLGSDTAVPSVRALALSGGVLSAGGDFGLRYWDGANWQPTSGIPPGVVMDLAVGETAQNQGPVYAVQWLNPRVYVNSDPAGSPGQWAEIGGIGDLTSKTVLAVAGTGSSVRFVGTQTVHLSLVNNSWQTVQNRPGRSFAIDGPVAYAGYGDGSGIYKSADAGLTFQPANDGFGTIPEIVYELILQGEDLYAATSEGVFVR
jgi:hypothetical protein